MKHTHIQGFVLKITIITSVILASVQIIQLFFVDSKVPINIQDYNSQVYQSAYSANIGGVGIALSTRIGLQYDSISGTTLSNNFYKEVLSIGTNSEEKYTIRSEMIVQNMQIIRDYLNLSRSDIKSILDSSSDRQSTLENFISQLEIRYKNSALSLQSLEKQKQLLLQEMSQVEISIANVKSHMEIDFSENKANDTLADVDEYFILRARYTESFTDIVFINQFIRQHGFLNNYNKGILDTLINNKEALINQSHIVIPDSGDEYLRPLDLIFDEAEIKAKR